MSDDYQALVREKIQEETGFIRAIFSGQQIGTASPWVKVTLRPILLKDERNIQFAYFDAKRCITKNYPQDKLTEPLDDLLQQPFRNIHITSGSGELQVNVSKKGKPIVHRGKATDPTVPKIQPHNREKERPLAEGKPDAYLQAIGFMTADGQIRADKQKKFKQINEFLKLLEQTGELEKFDSPQLQIIDFGCGNAYLTFAVYHYLNHIRDIPASLTGVDLQGNLLDKHTSTAESLGWEQMEFVKSSIAEFVPPSPPEIILALHACDTATDDALAQGIRWQSKLIFSAPCCHHYLQEQLSHLPTPEPFRPVARHGILSERMGDVLTDTFRALILRIMGYQTDVMQFISAEHTAKNLMIRAIRSDVPAPSSFVAEYKAMKEYWGVTPYLETLLGESLLERLR